MLWRLVLLLASLVVYSETLKQAANGTFTVETNDGTVRGQVLTSYWGRSYYAFQSIPYAQPPVGDLRFKSPRPVQKWKGVRDALAEGPYCPQAQYINTSSSASEDCLYINVFIPKVPEHLSKKPLTVMAWIHGGGFQNGSGIRDSRGPDNFMNLTSILVTFNYRLGALGFLSLEHPDVTTNAGMKDQVAALRWIQRNIASFGGNPRDVTLFGQSAGGVSVELHLLSPLSNGLFHRTITESGSSLVYRTDYNGTRGAYRLAEVLGHNATSRDDLVRFLRSARAEDIVAAQTLAATEEDGRTVALKTQPTVEPRTRKDARSSCPTPRRT
ncbi:esterase B1-like [Bacillus rossius redtenbacheri]|uniref:esterase B1-like n=1 Tax=Bacillus rossius redtenbacheri TaxID=93214 RepID=UPI002FDD44C1